MMKEVVQLPMRDPAAGGHEPAEQCGQIYRGRQNHPVIESSRWTGGVIAESEVGKGTTFTLQIKDYQ